MLKDKNLGGPCHATNICFPCVSLFSYGLVLYRLQYLQCHFMDQKLCLYMRNLLCCSLTHVFQEVGIDRILPDKMVNVFLCKIIHFSYIFYVFLQPIPQRCHALVFSWKFNYILNQRNVALLVDLMDFLIKILAFSHGFRNLITYSPESFPKKF